MTSCVHTHGLSAACANITNEINCLIPRHAYTRTRARQTNTKSVVTIATDGTPATLRGLTSHFASIMNNKLRGFPFGLALRICRVPLKKQQRDKVRIRRDENSFAQSVSEGFFFFFFCHYFLSQTPKISFATKRREVDVFRLPEWRIRVGNCFFFRRRAGRKPCAQNESPFPIPRSIPRIVVTIWRFSPGGSVRPQNRATKDIRL